MRPPPILRRARLLLFLAMLAGCAASREFDARGFACDIDADCAGLRCVDGICGDAPSNKPPVDPPKGTASGVHFTVTGPREVGFAWTGDATRLRFGIDALDRVVEAVPATPTPLDSKGPFWFAELTELQPGATYRYAIGAMEAFTFTAPPTPGTSGIVVDVFSNLSPVQKLPAAATLHAQVAGGDADLALVLGDLTNAESYGPETVGEAFDDAMIWSRRIAYQPAWGDDDWEDAPADDLRNYKGRFLLPHPQTTPSAPESACTCGKDWSWFDYGNVRFIAYPERYNGNAWDDWGEAVSSVMEQAQADAAIRYIVTFGHRPIYATGRVLGHTQLRTILTNLAAAYPKYVLNLGGASRSYERAREPSGTLTEIVAGSAIEVASDTGSCPWSVCPVPDYVQRRELNRILVRLRFGEDVIAVEAICGESIPNETVPCAVGELLERVEIPAGK